MIQLVSSPAQAAEFRRRLASKPYYESVLGTYLTLFGAHPAAGFRFYLLPEAALCVRGGTATLCGRLPDANAREELSAFLHFAGADRLLCGEASPLPCWRRAAPLTVWELPKGHTLPLPPAPPPLWGLTLAENPPMRPVSRLVFADAAERDNFYAAACASVAHGLGVCRTLLTANGVPVCTVGNYARSAGEAYLSAGVTAPAWRGKGLAGHLIVGLANELAAARAVRFVCEPKLNSMYKKLGFIQIGEIQRFTAEEFDL